MLAVTKISKHARVTLWNAFKEGITFIANQCA